MNLDTLVRYTHLSTEEDFLMENHESKLYTSGLIIEFGEHMVHLTGVGLNLRLDRKQVGYFEARFTDNRREIK